MKTYVFRFLLDFKYERVSIRYHFLSLVRQQESERDGMTVGTRKSWFQISSFFCWKRKNNIWFSDFFRPLGCWLARCSVAHFVGKFSLNLPHLFAHFSNQSTIRWNQILHLDLLLPSLFWAQIMRNLRLLRGNKINVKRKTIHEIVIVLKREFEGYGERESASIHVYMCESIVSTWCKHFNFMTNILAFTFITLIAGSGSTSKSMGNPQWQR